MRGAVVIGCLMMVGVGVGDAVRAAGEPHLPAKPEWTSALTASAAARTATVIPGDTASLPCDYEFAIGFEDRAGWLRGSGSIVRERERGIGYTGVAAEIRATERRAEIGWAYADMPDDGLYAHRAWVEARPVSWLGIGATRAYLAPGFRAGHWMARARLGYASARGSASATWEQAGHAQRIVASGSVVAASWSDGRYLVEPTAEVVSQRDEGRRSTAWRAKVVGKIGIE